MCPVHEAMLTVPGEGGQQAIPFLCGACVSSGTKGGPINFHPCRCRGPVSREASQTLPTVRPLGPQRWLQGLVTAAPCTVLWVCRPS